MTNHESNVCPICGAGSLHSVGFDREAEHNGRTGMVSMESSECDVCHTQQATPAQLRNNKRAMIAFQKKMDDRLTGEEVRTLRTKMKLTQSQSSKLFGGGANAFSKYESDDICQSEAMDKLIRICSEVPQALEWLKMHSVFEHSKHITRTQLEATPSYANFKNIRDVIAPLHAAGYIRPTVGLFNRRSISIDDNGAAIFISETSPERYIQELSQIASERHNVHFTHFIGQIDELPSGSNHLQYSEADYDRYTI